MTGSRPSSAARTRTDDEQIPCDVNHDDERAHTRTSRCSRSRAPVVPDERTSRLTHHCNPSFCLTRATLPPSLLLPTFSNAALTFFVVAFMTTLNSMYVAS